MNDGQRIQMAMTAEDRTLDEIMRDLEPIVAELSTFRFTKESRKRVLKLVKQIELNDHRFYDALVELDDLANSLQDDGWRTSIAREHRSVRLNAEKSGLTIEIKKTLHCFYEKFSSSLISLNYIAGNHKTVQHAASAIPLMVKLHQIIVDVCGANRGLTIYLNGRKLSINGCVLEFDDAFNVTRIHDEGSRSKSSELTLEQFRKQIRAKSYGHGYITFEGLLKFFGKERDDVAVRYIDEQDFDEQDF